MLCALFVSKTIFWGSATKCWSAMAVRKLRILQNASILIVWHSLQRIQENVWVKNIHLFLLKIHHYCLYFVLFVWLMWKVYSEKSPQKTSFAQCKEFLVFLSISRVILSYKQIVGVVYKWKREIVNIDEYAHMHRYTYKHTHAHTHTDFPFCSSSGGIPHCSAPSFILLSNNHHWF
jgi:hypothetical protein